MTAPAPSTLGVLTSEACTDTTLLAGLAGTLPGAVIRPVELIVPTVELPPATPATDQVTAVFDVPVTAAVNCIAGSPGRTLAVAGLTDTLGGAEKDDVPAVLAQPIARNAGEMRTTQSVQFNRRVDKGPPFRPIVRRNIR